MSTRGDELIAQVVADPWSDPVAAATSAAEGLLALDPAELELVAARLRARRNDQPLLLALSEAAASDSPVQALRRIRGSLVDSAWVEEPAAQIAAYSSAGVLAVGPITRFVLEAAVAVGGEIRSLFTDQRAVAIGLGYLPLEIVASRPEEAAVLVLPAVATHRERLWTSAYAADAAEQAIALGKPYVVVAHPLCRLSTSGRQAFRPPSYIVDWKR